MKFQIIENKLLSGRAAKIYTIKENGDDSTYLDHFIEDNIEKHSQEVGTILSKLKGMGHCTGCEWNLFEHNEGHGGDGVACIKAGCFRLYCMYFRETLVICGSGGWKNPAIRAYQEDDALNKAAQQMKDVAAKINESLRTKDIEIDNDGKINFYNDDYEGEEG